MDFTSFSSVSDSRSSIINTFFKLTKTVSTLLGSAAVLGLGSLYWFQSKLVYPAYIADGHGKVDTPDVYGMDNYEHIDVVTRDNETIKMFVIRNDSSKIDYSNKTVLMLCPNAGNMGHSLPIAQLFYVNMKCNVIIYSYRGYGKSTGTPSEAGLKIDAESVCEWIMKDNQISNSKIILHGRSLGGAVAIYIASSHPNLIGGIILENTFLSITKLIPYLFPYLKYVSFLCHEKWNSENLIPEIPSNIPILFLSGAKDEIVPPIHMKELFKLSKSLDKTFKEFPNGFHNDTIVQENYWYYVDQFIEKI
ncbi:hypothetical protein PACTADRAFT_51761 [Pachysolen tannophilus NRRL Y-2460]|uniref:AB hydrolase-1 domain-containing protein n=1 Tax=Pachysolen tannophilus NRRL Y-2460 TaxID=669874 RepID=A0A1E4TN11_PACTA|nr:hypothetical protein PACTADRAFT_51761 [Pachysolen tannophilus NRRL Y-2460]